MNTDVSRIGPYRVLRSLGGGGFAEVFLGEDTRQKGGQLVALKRVRRDLKKADPYFRESLLSEGFLARRVTSPHIVRVDGLIEDNGEPVLVLEYIEGFGLDALLRHFSSRGLGEGPAVALACQMCRALRALHEVEWQGDESWQSGGTGIIHQDLKPANVRITPNGLVKVLDLGIAVVEAQPVARIRQGTPGYRSPEQSRGEAVLTAASDIYTLGILLYEMLKGIRLFPDNIGRNNEIYQQAQKDMALRLKVEADTFPPGLLPILERLLATDMEKRYARAAQVQVDLERWMRTSRMEFDLAGWCRQMARAISRAEVAARPARSFSGSSGYSMEALGEPAGEGGVVVHEDVGVGWEPTPTRPLPPKTVEPLEREVTDGFSAILTELGPPRPRLPRKLPTAEGLLPYPVPPVSPVRAPAPSPRKRVWRRLEVLVMAACLVVGFFAWRELATPPEGHQVQVFRGAGEAPITALAPSNPDPVAEGVALAPITSAPPVEGSIHADLAPQPGATSTSGSEAAAPPVYVPTVGGGGLAILGEVESAGNVASLQLESVPAEAQVSLDKRGKVGTTPLTLEDLPMGRHHISLKDPTSGKVVEMDIQLPAGARVGGTWDFQADGWR